MQLFTNESFHSSVFSIATYSSNDIMIGNSPIDSLFYDILSQIENRNITL